MAEQMKMMQDGMQMMGKMREMKLESNSKMKGRMATDFGMQHQMMEKRMEMMQTMMKMMIDQMPAVPSAHAK